MNALVLAALGALALPAPAAAAPSPEKAVAEAEKCFAGVESWIRKTEQTKAKRCRDELPPLDEAIKAHAPELDALSCSEGDLELRRYWRCRELSTDKPAQRLCEWTAGRKDGPGAPEHCLAADERTCADGEELAFTDFALLGRAVIDGDAAGTRRHCESLFGERAGDGCARIAEGKPEGVCLLPGFYMNVLPPGTPALCPVSVDVLLGRADCASLFPGYEGDMTIVVQLKELCRELALFRKARAAGDASRCGRSPDAPVCRVLLSGDKKDCEPSARRVKDAACGRAVARLDAAAGYHERNGVLRELSDGLPAELWERCQKAATAADAILYEASPDGATAAHEPLRARLKELEGKLFSVRPR